MLQSCGESVICITVRRKKCNQNFYYAEEIDTPKKDFRDM